MIYISYNSNTYGCGDPHGIKTQRPKEVEDAYYVHWNNILKANQWNRAHFAKVGLYLEKR